MEPKGCAAALVYILGCAVQPCKAHGAAGTLECPYSTLTYARYPLLSHCFQALLWGRFGRGCIECEIGSRSALCSGLSLGRHRAC